MRLVLPLLVSTLLAACTTTPPAATPSRVVQFPALPPGATVDRWQHVCVSELTANQLTVAGAEGWELVGVAQSPGALVYCFKRREPAAPAPAVADELTALLDEGIVAVDATHVRIRRALVERVLENPLLIAKGARVVPSIKDGQPTGYKLYAIRPSSLYARLGLRNGDTVHAINGVAIGGPEDGLDVYQQLRRADQLELSLTRRGAPVTLTITVE